MLVAPASCKRRVAGASILYTGGTVGRRITDPPDACKDAEAFMVADHDAGRVSLKANVIIAPHHGADNASSQCFIQRVDPDYVVFSAGHEYQHPGAGMTTWRS